MRGAKELLDILVEVEEDRLLDVFSRDEVRTLLLTLRHRQESWNRSNERAAEKRRLLKDAIAEARARARLGDREAESFLKRLGMA